MTGLLVAVVGPSGVGKDTVMAAIAAAWPEIALVRRVITRAPELGGEEFSAVSATAFDEMEAAGEFCLSWRAHGLAYGIPSEVRDAVMGGRVMLVNLSRKVLSDAAAAFPEFLVLSLTARRETLAARLAARGRETEADILARLQRSSGLLPDGVRTVTISNDGALDATVAAALDALYPVRA